jgi:hypothetical protein
MNWYHREPTLDEILSDSIVRAMMEADGIEPQELAAKLRQAGPKQDHNTMADDLKFQLRLTLSDEFAPVARNDPGDPSISTLTDVLNRHDAVMKCQFDAFADYVREAEASGIENFPLYEWTKKTIDEPAKEAKYTKSFALYVGGDEVYEKAKADALEAELKPLVGGPIVAKMFKYDTDPAHNPQPPRQK